MSHLSEEALDDLIDRERTRSIPPLNDWEMIAARLRAEGLIRSSGGRKVFNASPWLRAAAAIMLIAGGAAAGRFSAPRAATTVLGDGEAQYADPGTAAARTASLSGTNENPATFRSTDEAWETLNRAGAEYQRASAYLAASNTKQKAREDSASLYRTRLAALEQVMHATKSALDRAPNDPVINQYYLATMGAREATIQSLSARPVGIKLKGF